MVLSSATMPTSVISNLNLKMRIIIVFLQVIILKQLQSIKDGNINSS